MPAVVKYLLPLLAFAALFWAAVNGSDSCFSKKISEKNAPQQAPDDADTLPTPGAFAFDYVVPHAVEVEDYFKFVDTLTARLDTLVDYELTGILLVRANPWLIDTFQETDYYRRKARGEFVFDQKKMVVLRAGDTLRVPGDSLAAVLQAKMDSTWIDVNIPEFRLRIVEGASDTLFSFPVRVGQNRKRYLESIGRVEDLRTKTGVGKIVRINRYPPWIDPVTGKKYKDTGRDDGLRTKLPQIPWLEPAINGRRWGQLIHPTTNPETLGKAYSNGCIGLKEADAWVLYFYAPIGTRVVIRNNRRVITPAGDTLLLPDVYDKKKFKIRN